MQTISRAFRVLEVLVNNPPHAQLGVIARESQLPPPTTYRILQSLVELGYATSLDNGSYRPGPRILELAGAFLATMDYAVHVRPALLQLQEHTPETIHFGILSGDQAHYVDKLEGRQPYRMASVVGMGLHLHSTAIGKSILAHLPPDRVATFMTPERLIAKTPRTITDPERLQRELARIREQGFCLDDEEDRQGIRCVGAPVFDHQGAVVGAISVSAPTFNFSVQDALALAPHLIDAARATSLSLGARPVGPVARMGEHLASIDP